MADRPLPEDMILPELADLIEAALELVSGTDAMSRLDEVARLAGEVQRLAAAAADPPIQGG